MQVLSVNNRPLFDFGNCRVLMTFKTVISYSQFAPFNCFPYIYNKAASGDLENIKANKHMQITIDTNIIIEYS